MYVIIYLVDFSRYYNSITILKWICIYRNNALKVIISKLCIGDDISYTACSPWKRHIYSTGQAVYLIQVNKLRSM